MHLNTLSPAPGSRPSRRRVGRGIGCGYGKTCGRGHKGQKSRSGGYSKVGFEGGQMPMQRRLPKVGFVARKSFTSAQIRLNELNNLEGDVIDVAVLKAAGLVGKSVLSAKVFASGEVTKAVTLKGITVSKGAREAIEAAGGKIED
ncbi:MAG TPA: 50S ribosomal protein L15 [Gammaproteobacteria bacterium]|nr:50S ribosomal protein L15 [Gammaproteobacteria bacterium]